MDSSTNVDQPVSSHEDSKDVENELSTDTKRTIERFTESSTGMAGSDDKSGQARIAQNDNQDVITSNVERDNVDGDSHEMTGSCTDGKQTLPASSDGVQDKPTDGPAPSDKIEGEPQVALEADEDDNDGEPIPSGTGIVSKECSASELVGWSEILPRWHNKLNQRPKGLNPLVRNGVPEPLRGEVWQLLSGAHQCVDLMDQYRIYLTKSSPAEQIILRDVHRTYPAHENFRSDAGSDSLVDSLFKVCKAYSVYDGEVGYCQGLSFLVAALLLHMPEEQAFCVFVRIMQHYGLRDLFRNNFDVLYLKFYQLERLLEDHMPDLYHHFKRINIEPFQYASQWFLTVFTAKFPLNAVFYIMDVFLLAGIETIFQIALALLSASKQELLALDFEGVLKFFRVQMPKRYRNQEHVQQLIVSASEISLKRLKTYAKNYEAMKKKEMSLESPSMKRENAKLTEAIVRLENENDGLARDLIASKIQLRSQLDALEDKIEILDRALTYSRQDGQSYLNTISDMEDERSRLEIEVTQLKEVCRRELQRAETELKRNGKIIEDYKKICSQLSRRLDFSKKLSNQFVESGLDLLRDNDSCAGRVCLKLLQSKADAFREKLDSDNADESELSSTSKDSPTSTDGQEHRERKASTGSDRAKRPVGAYVKTDSQSTSSELKIKQLTEHIDELEVELARTKLALVESECERQQLIHGTASQPVDKSPSVSTGLSTKFDFVRSAISSASPSRAKEVQTSGTRGTSALTRINNLISEKISNIGQQGQQPATAMPDSASRPAKAQISDNGPRLGARVSDASNNNNRIPDNNNLSPRPADGNEHQC